MQPNPFSSSFVVEYYTDENSIIKVELLNKLGQIIKLLDAGKKQKGLNKLSISNKNMSLPQGVYTLKLTIDRVSYSKLIIKTE